MSWYLSRTDGELVALATRGDRSARDVLVDRTLLPASRVAMHLEPDADQAVGALVAAYGEAFAGVHDLHDGGRFLPLLLARLDRQAPFPLDPATHAPLAPVDRDRVRAAVTGDRARRRAVPLAAVLATAAVVAVVVGANAATPPSVTVRDDPAGTVADAVAPAPAPTPTTTPTATATPTASSDPPDPARSEGLEPAGGPAASDPDARPAPPPSGAPSVEATFDGGTGTGELAETP